MEQKSVFDPAPTAPRREFSPLLIGALFMVVTLMAAAGYFGWRSVELERENKQLTQTVDEMLLDLQRQAEEAKRDKAQLMTVHQEEVDRLNAEMTNLNEEWREKQKQWEQRMVAREPAYRDRIQRSFDTLASVVNDTGSTLDYLQEMETKIQNGKKLQQEETEQLKVIARGLGYLQAQYEKPLEEFKEMEASIQSELAESPQTTPPTEERKFLRAMFDWNYRERQKAKEEAYLKEQGRREALKDTQQELATRYARAQREMAAIKNQFGTQLENIDQLLAAQTANAAEMSSFLEMSSEMIKIHQRVLNIQVEPVPSTETPLVTGPEATPVKP